MNNRVVFWKNLFNLTSRLHHHRPILRRRHRQNLRLLRIIKMTRWRACWNCCATMTSNVPNDVTCRVRHTWAWNMRKTIFFTNVTLAYVIVWTHVAKCSLQSVVSESLTDIIRKIVACRFWCEVRGLPCFDLKHIALREWSNNYLSLCTVWIIPGIQSVNWLLNLRWATQNWVVGSDW